MVSLPDPFSEQPDPARRISQVTRRDIFDYIRTEGGPWHGRMDEIAFLGRLYDLEALPLNGHALSDCEPRHLPAPREQLRLGGRLGLH
jgi:hypothetical protein